jgi:hypothetical protein
MDSKEVKELKKNYKLTFGSESGEKVLEDLLKRFHYHTSTFSKDSNETMFLEGQRSVILFLQNILNQKEHITNE